MPQLPALLLLIPVTGLWDPCPHIAGSEQILRVHWGWMWPWFLLCSPGQCQWAHKALFAKGLVTEQAGAALASCERTRLHHPWWREWSWEAETAAVPEPSGHVPVPLPALSLPGCSGMCAREAEHWPGIIP